MATITTVGAAVHLYRAHVLKTAGLPGEVFQISNAAIVAALPPGPLRRLYQATYATAAAAQDALRDSPDADLRIIALNTSTTDPQINIGIDGNNLAVIDGGLSGAQNVAAVVVTSVFRHSAIR